jgi:16S rRNA processing protein RimM
MSNRICIAKIATAHGIKGFVKLHVFADDETLANGTLFTSESGDKTLSLTLKNATAKHWLAQIEGITDRTQAEKLRGTELYIDKESLPDTDDDEAYIADLIGLSCIDTSNKHIGKIIAVENFGASDLLEILPSHDESFYLPYTDDTILEISDTTVTIDIPEGLLD